MDLFYFMTGKSLGRAQDYGDEVLNAGWLPQLEAAAKVRAGAGTVRVLKPGDAATTELDGGRLNLDVDARNRVTDVRCG